MQQAVYKLEPILDEPRFEGFGSGEAIPPLNEQYMLDVFFPDTDVREWKTLRLAAIWKPFKAIGRVRKFNDYPCVDMAIPTFSKRAVDALRDILEPNGELLPVTSDIGPYWCYNATTIVDALDCATSNIKLNSRGLPGYIHDFVFHKMKLTGLSIFRIPEDRTCILVTESFRQRVQQADLEGFNFIKLWPLPPGAAWETASNKAASDAPEQSVAIRLLFEDNSIRPTREEKQLVNQMMDQLDALLVDPDARPDTIPLGTLQGHEYVDGECRLFLNCADANRLARRLQPLLKKADWAGEMILVKRYGLARDEDAREANITIK